MELKIEIPIRRTFIQKNRNLIFLYSFDVVGKSFFGQSYEAHGEENSFGIPVMWKACKSSGFFQSSQFDKIKIELDNAFSKIPIDGRYIIPFPKIGQGHSRFFEFCPKGFKYMMDSLDIIKHPNIVYTYGQTH